MAGRVISFVFIFCRRSFYRILTFFSDVSIRNQVGGYSGTFEVHFSVEIRNPRQVRFGKNLIVKKGCIMNGRSNSHQFGLDFGDEIYVKEYCYIDSYGGKITLAGYSAIGQFTMIAGQGGITIGKYVMIGGHSYILSSNHKFSSSGLPFILQGDRTKEVVIEDNVWIGGGSVILGGITIGHNSVIGAGSIVYQDVPANSIYVNSRTDPIITAIRFKADL